MRKGCFSLLVVLPLVFALAGCGLISRTPFFGVDPSQPPPQAPSQPLPAQLILPPKEYVRPGATITGRVLVDPTSQQKLDPQTLAATLQGAVVDDGKQRVPVNGKGLFVFKLAEDAQSVWVRLVTPAMGGKSGMYFLPEVSHEVIVTPAGEIQTVTPGAASGGFRCEAPPTAQAGPPYIVTGNLPGGGNGLATTAQFGRQDAPLLWKTDGAAAFDTSGLQPGPQIFSLRENGQLIAAGAVHGVRLMAATDRSTLKRKEVANFEVKVEGLPGDFLAEKEAEARAAGKSGDASAVAFLDYVNYTPNIGHVKGKPNQFSVPVSQHKMLATSSTASGADTLSLLQATGRTLWPEYSGPNQPPIPVLDTEGQMRRVKEQGGKPGAATSEPGSCAACQTHCDSECAGSTDPGCASHCMAGCSGTCQPSTPTPNEPGQLPKALTTTYSFTDTQRYQGDQAGSFNVQVTLRLPESATQSRPLATKEWSPDAPLALTPLSSQDLNNFMLNLLHPMSKFYPVVSGTAEQERHPGTRGAPPRVPGPSTSTPGGTPPLPCAPGPSPTCQDACGSACDSGCAGSKDPGCVPSCRSKCVAGCPAPCAPGLSPTCSGACGSGCDSACQGTNDPDCGSSCRSKCEGACAAPAQPELKRGIKLNWTWRLGELPEMQAQELRGLPDLSTYAEVCSHPSAVKSLDFGYADITIQAAAPRDPQLLQQLRSAQGQTQKCSFEASSFGSAGSVRDAFNFQNCLITEVGIPASSGEQKDAVKMTIKIDPNFRGPLESERRSAPRSSAGTPAASGLSNTGAPPREPAPTGPLNTGMPPTEPQPPGPANTGMPPREPQPSGPLNTGMPPTVVSRSTPNFKLELPGGGTNEFKKVEGLPSVEQLRNREWASIKLEGPTTKTRSQMLAWYQQLVKQPQPKPQSCSIVADYSFSGGSASRRYDFTSCFVTGYCLSCLSAESAQECEETVTIHVGTQESYLK